MNVFLLLYMVFSSFLLLVFSMCFLPCACVCVCVRGRNFFPCRAWCRFQLLPLPRQYCQLSVKGFIAVIQFTRYKRFTVYILAQSRIYINMQTLIIFLVVSYVENEYLHIQIRLRRFFSLYDIAHGYGKIFQRFLPKISSRFISHRSPVQHHIYPLKHCDFSIVIIYIQHIKYR